jgi:hypothetical protein
MLTSKLRWCVWHACCGWLSAPGCTATSIKRHHTAQELLSARKAHLSLRTNTCVLQAIAVLGHSLAALRAEPSKEWLLAYLTAAESCQLASTPAGCSVLLHTLATWKPLQQAAVAYAPSQQTSSKMQPRSPGLPQAVPAVRQLSGSCQALHSKAADPLDEALGWLTWSLVQQCAVSFSQQGDAFTAEQLGMFCKGLARLGIVSSRELCQILHQVRLRERDPGRKGACLLDVLVTWPWSAGILQQVACCGHMLCALLWCRVEVDVSAIDGLVKQRCSYHYCFSTPGGLLAIIFCFAMPATVGSVSCLPLCYRCPAMYCSIKLSQPPPSHTCCWLWPSAALRRPQSL